ncbi:MAG: fructokinase [Massilia sp.]|nr:fructokinase [Massilia sp.]
MKKIVCFGEALIDFLAEPSTKPGAAQSFLRNAGGAPANVAVAVAALGGKVAFVGMLGKDMFGDFLMESLEDAGVDTQYIVRTDEANTALAFVTLDSHGERSFSFYRPPAADLLFRQEHFDDGCFNDLFALHVCSNSLTEPAIAGAALDGIRRARNAGALVSFDMNLRPALWHANVNPLPLLWQTIALADVVKFSTEEMAYLAEHGGDEASVLEKLWLGKTRLVIVTHGADAIHWYTPNGRGTVPAFKVQAVDTTAAGDAFVAGFLVCLAEQQVNPANLLEFTSGAMDDTLRFAAACGAVAVTRHGAFAAMPSGADVNALLEASI